MDLRSQLNKFEMFILNLIHEITLKTALLYKKTVLRENHVNRKCKIIEITIYLYRCYEHESPTRCNTNVYLSWLLHSKDVLRGNLRTGEHKNIWSLQYLET